MTTLSEMIVNARKIQVDKTKMINKCAFCGENLDCLSLKLHDTFTGYEFIHDTNFICIYCNELYQNPEYRNNNWICYTDEFKILHKSEIIPEIIKPKSYPFAIYTTRTYKKQGWIRMSKDLNYNSQIIIIECDMEKLFMKRSELRRWIQITKSLLEKGLTKSELLSGEISKRNCSEIDNLAYVLTQLNRIKYDPNFKWVVDFYMKGEKDNDGKIEN